MSTNRFLALLLMLHCGIALACFDTDQSIPVSDLLPRAERGDASAQFSLAEEYRRGEYDCGRGEIAGVPQDFNEARRWYTMAADQGNADAAFALATMYINGEGIEPDRRAAHNWLQRAADEGSLPARNLIQNGLF
jgi:TPR repeat protein